MIDATGGPPPPPPGEELDGPGGPGGPGSPNAFTDANVNSDGFVDEAEFIDWAESQGYTPEEAAAAWGTSVDGVDASDGLDGGEMKMLLEATSMFPAAPEGAAAAGAGIATTG